MASNLPPSAPSVATTSAIDSGSQIVVMLFSLIAGIVLARVLGDEGRGMYVFATVFAGQIVFSLVNLGVELSASVLMAKDKSRLSSVHSLIMMISVGLLFLLTIATRWAGDWMTQTLFPGLKWHALLAITLAVPFWVYQTGAYGILIGLNANRTRALFEVVLNFVQSAVVVTLLVMLRHEPMEEVVRYLILAFYLIIIGGSFCLWGILVFRGARWQVPSWELTRAFFSYGFWVYVGNMGNNLQQRVDQYFVKLIAVGAGPFGVYTLATSLTNRTRIFPQALTRSVYGRLCSVETPEAARLTAACFRQMLALGILVCAGGALLAPLIPVIYSEDFRPAVVPFIIFLFGRLFANCAWMLANFFTGHLARPKIPMVVNWAILPVQAVAAWVAMKLGGLVAVAVVTSLSYGLLFIVFLALFLKWQKYVGAAELFRLGPEDLAPWKRLIGRFLR